MESTEVRDFDELDDREKTCLLRLANDESPERIEPKTATRLSEYGVIKYTEFVAVARTRSPERA